MEQHAFTLKTQAALQAAQGLAMERKHTQVEPLHILHSLLHSPDPLPERLLDRLEVPATAVKMATLKALDALATADHLPENTPWSQQAQNTLRRSVEEARKGGDQYVALDRIFAAILAVNSTASRILKDAGAQSGDLSQRP